MSDKSDPSETQIKVTDKRMFAPDGSLREEYRYLERTGERSEPEPDEPPAAEAAPPGAEGQRTDEAGSGGTEPERPRLEIPGTPEGMGAPSFVDLVATLAEPASVYLGDARLPDGSSAENLEAARLYIDLLDVLRQKTAGNLSAQESSFVEELLYRLRLRYVQKRG